MPVPIKFTADMTQVRKEVDALIQDVSTRSAVINPRIGDVTSGRPSADAALGSSAASASADPLFGAAANMANKYGRQFASNGSRLFQNLFGIDQNRAKSLAIAVASQPGGADAVLSGGTSVAMTTSHPIGGGLSSPLGAGGFFTQGFGAQSPQAGPSPRVTGAPAGSFWNAVAALGQPGAPAGFWNGQPAAQNAPPLSSPQPAPPPVRPSRWGRFERYMTTGFIADRVVAVGEAAAELGREERLATGGPRGDVDLMRQYKAEVGFAGKVASFPVFGGIASLIAEGVTGWGEQAARTIQEANQGDVRAANRHAVAVANKAADLQTYVVEARGGHAQLLRSAEVQLWQQQTQAWERRQEMVRSGDQVGAADKYYNDANMQFQRQYKRNVEHADRIWNAQGARMEATAVADATRSFGFTERADVQDMEAEIRYAYDTEEDAGRKAMIADTGARRVASYRRGRARGRHLSAEAARRRGVVWGDLLDRDPLKARIDEIEGDLQNKFDEDPEMSAEQRRRFTNEATGRKELAKQEDADRRLSIMDRLGAEAAGMRYAIANQAFTGETMTIAGLAIAGSNAIRRANKNDADIANGVLGNAILEMQVRRKQVYESFEAQEVDPTLTSFTGPRRGEDPATKLEGIRQAIINLQNALVNGGGNIPATTGP